MGNSGSQRSALATIKMIAITEQKEKLRGWEIGDRLERQASTLIDEIENMVRLWFSNH